MAIKGKAIHPRLYTMRVSFDPQAKQPIGFPDGDTIDVDTPLAMIAIQLELVQGNEDAELLVDPLTWMDENEEPISLPACLIVQRTSARNVTVIDTNVEPGSQSFRFALSLEHGGKIYVSRDPAIVNKDIPDTSWDMLSSLKSRVA